MVTWLAENGADPNAYNYLGETPMHVALKMGRSETMRELEIRGGQVMGERRRERQLQSQRSGEVRSYCG